MAEKERKPVEPKEGGLKIIGEKPKHKQNQKESTQEESNVSEA